MSGNSSNLLYVHEDNLITKIKTDYNHKKAELEEFKSLFYEPFRRQIEQLPFDELHPGSFDTAAVMLNKYYSDLREFSQKNRISSQSKFGSTLFEELNTYLFKDLPLIKDGTFGIFNKGIFAGLKVISKKNSTRIEQITKDVDFCIGRKAEVTVTGQKDPLTLILPVICVECKTYLDSTMFGEIKSSSRDIRNANPNARTYVLMGYRDLKDEPLLAARQDSALTEMFSLSDHYILNAKGKKVKQKEVNIVPAYLRSYWHEISTSLPEALTEHPSPEGGPLLLK